MGRGAQIVYPRTPSPSSARRIGARSTVVEAGVGSGALTCFLLTAVGPHGRVVSYELRPEFAEVARRNVNRWFDDVSGWELRLGDVAQQRPDLAADAMVLDLLAPGSVWTQQPRRCARGRLVAYVATTTQLSLLTESLRADGRWTEPRATESMVRTWHLEGLAVQPDHRMIAHTAFLLVCRRLADGQRVPADVVVRHRGVRSGLHRSPSSCG